MNPKININNLPLVYEYLSGNIKTNEFERYERGEVFTPIKIVEDMLDKLPKEVWSNPSLKWLDPAVGIGNFMVVVYDRLMVGLMSVITNRKKRQKHILEKMLYMVEISAESIGVLNNIFCKKDFNINIFNGSFINTDENVAVYNPENSFDIVVGNPPYNQGGIMSSKRAVGCKLKRTTLWNAFIDKSFALLKRGGLLLFITPLSWLKETNRSHYSILNRRLIYLELWDGSKSRIEIDAGIALSIFLAENVENEDKEKAVIKVDFCKRTNSFLSGTYKEYLNPIYDIPFAYHTQLLKMFQFTIDNECSLEKGKITSGSKSSELLLMKKKDKGLIQMSYDEVINLKAEDNYFLDTYIPSKDFYLLNKVSSHTQEASVRKLILCNKSILSGLVVDDGNLSMSASSPNTYYTGDNLELIKKMFGFKISQVLAFATKYHMELLNREFCKFYPDLRKLGITDIEEDAFYDLIKLSADEKEELYKVNITSF